MENSKKPINPLPSDVDSSKVECKGLTKREYFAGLAMQGLCANYLRENVTGWDVKTYAIESVALADELLEQLEINTND